MLKESPEWGRGEKEFYSYFIRNFKNPNEPGEGEFTMEIHFDVKANGTVTNIKTLPSLGSSIDQEVSRVIRGSGKWNSAKVRGQPVDADHKIALKYKVGPATVIRQEIRRTPIGQAPRVRNF